MSCLSIYRPLGLPNWLPFRQQIALLIEDLDPAVAAIADKQPALAIHRQGVIAVQHRGEGLVPQELQALMNLPFLSYLTMREFDGWVSWPSATKMSPFGVGFHRRRLRQMGFIAAIDARGTPSVISNLPLGLNLRTSAPLTAWD